MHTFILLSALLISCVLAVPKPFAKPQYGPASAALSKGFMNSTVGVTTTIAKLPASSTIPSSVIATLTSTSSVLPEPTPREQAGVYICSDVNWAGECIHSLANVGTAPEDCTPLDGLASSVGPDVGFTCWFYTNVYCRSLQSNGTDLLELTYPGNANLLITPKGDLNDKLFSYHCLRTV